jgi:hypothetical protein
MGRFDSDSQFTHKGKRNGCHTASFYFTREQSHGPRADGSGRYQHYEINVVLGKEETNLVAWQQ